MIDPGLGSLDSPIHDHDDSIGRNSFYAERLYRSLIRQAIFGDDRTAVTLGDSELDQRLE